MAESNYEKSNPVLYHYKGIPIRRFNTVNLRIDEITYKELIDAEVETGLSQRKILAYSGMPCKSCEGTFVTAFTDNGEVKIKRGIFSKRIPNTNGVNKIKKANGKINSYSKTDK